MATHNNAASRLHAILTRVAGQGQNRQTLDAWADTFGIVEKKPAERALRVVEKLALLYDELAEVRDRLPALSGLEQSFYVGHLNRIQEALSTTNLSAHWNNYRTHLAPETLTALQYWSAMLPDEEQVIDPSELTQLLADVEALEQSVASSTLPNNVKRLIEKLAGEVRSAVQNYSIAGAKALREGALKAVVDAAVLQDELRPYSESEQVGLLGKILNKANSVATAVIQGDKAITAASHIAGLLEKLL